MRLTMKEKWVITATYFGQYRIADKKGKSTILDEFIRLTGYNRKYALHILTHWGKEKLTRIGGKLVKLKAEVPRKRKKREGKRIYGEEVIAAWKPFGITPDIRKKLMTISPATIDRRLREDRNKLNVKGKNLTKPGSLLKKHIPIRTYYPWNDRKPGFFETDTVHHCGTSEKGEFCLTLDATDVCSGWVELRPLPNKAHSWTFKALSDIKATVPLPVVEFHSDNGSEFINNATEIWCKNESLPFTRSRDHKKNDNCFVEQKNGAVVREYVGCDRLSGFKEQALLAAVYTPLVPLLNFFMPSQKLKSKTRVGSKEIKVYDQSRSPFQRLIESGMLCQTDKDALTEQYALYNPVVLQQNVNKAILRLRQRLAQANRIQTQEQK
jgi:hypothetical protein